MSDDPQSRSRCGRKRGHYVIYASGKVDDRGADHRAAVLAHAVGMSERHFARMFSAEIGEPPARYVERVRLQAARTLLETDDQTVSAIATRCGFGTSETMRRTFVRRLGVPPDGYRDRFNLTIVKGSC